ncbi:hypothetical protein JH06_2176 [Blastocystis sp. subtype 4]|uniref:hypothetical protein n=1 Tax=Blastocystis sp. subtype 4 TaxID=944170 RepID=UPI0007113FA1|nr:hypothetical protein JH06_2176 [Blastocystis sp. subtype 4]KNB44053.1 hypothetical protein JH06_2176 [Blastocystis sp. subtype 4]|eukprot:XP_014527496.1 hypothetical protein JH06_2176 [Blastocystis sp. subtype 4]
MNAIADQPATSTEIVNKTTEKKKVSALVKVKRAVKRFGKTNFSKKVGDMINFVVRSSWSLGRTAGRLCWVAGCYAMIVLFPLAMEVDREQTMMEIQNRERERLTRPRHS